MAPKPADSTSGRHPDEAQAKVKAACEACRTRKIKCDGLRPICTSCQRKDKDCVYITEPDELRITALKRRYAELSKTSSNNEALIRLLRETPPHEAQAILERIRADESPSSIVTGVEQTHTGDVPATNLFLAVEGAEAQRSAGSSSSDASTPQTQQTIPPTEHLRGRVDRHSIAYLVDATQGQPQQQQTPAPSSSTSTEPLSHEQRLSRTASVPHLEAEKLSRSATAHLKPTPTHPLPTPRDRSIEKRTRFGEPARPGLQARHTWTTPATFRPKAGSGVDLLATKTRSTDASWKSRLGGVKAMDWNVHYTNDNTLLEILKCYFVWENPTLGLVDEDSFWDGLIAGGSDFCNESLVHAIVAFAAKMCFLFYPERATTIGHFALVAVTKLWDWDSDAKVPANSSTGLLIHATLVSNGQDIDGFAYLSGAVNIALESELFADERTPQTYPSSDPELAKLRAIFAWNLYSHQGMHLLMYPQHEQLLLDPPPVDLPEIEKEQDSKEWTPFPLQMPSRPGLLSSQRVARAMLWRTGSKIRTLHRRYKDTPRSEKHWHDALELFEELQSRQKALNGRLGILHGAPPHVFSLHSDYHRCVIDLFKPFVLEDEDVQAQAKFKPAREQNEDSRLQLRLLVHQMELELPNLPISLHFLASALVFVANDALVELKDKSEASDESFYFCLCLQMMRRTVDAYPLARFLIVAFQQIARRIGVALPSKARGIVESLGPVAQPALVPNGDLPVQLDLVGSNVQASTLQRLNEEFLGIAAERVQRREAAAAAATSREEEEG